MKINVERIRDDVIEEFVGIEEFCHIVNFFFSKLYNIETFREKSKYFTISKQVVFFALQRSLGKLETIEKKIQYLVLIEVIDKEFLDRIVAIKKRLQHLETLYNNNKIKAVIEGLKEIGNDVGGMKTEFKIQLR
jgi:uncharacterized coiled-coil DUF342 family protein